ncbi:hypothetical protein [Halorubrum sp. Atlit-26R]|jgi:hypothetical protein|uniref:hypothetical protein n=1 Tax=Halorubrum sp. Atlit-26R TaxID=2282128 RepID=UPI000EF1CB3C|nr:hypothetical protein [Halorubrum sp. Atlit-26R]RLM68511.1 hypothetical protein DVK07_10340 [Halorubrum sp. Atlit-26R]
MADDNSDEIPDAWTEMEGVELTGNGMRYVEHGWSHSGDPLWDVLVFRAEGEMNEVTDKDWGVQYPTADDMDPFDTEQEAVEAAKEYLREHAQLDP